jgi:hypothetical protein
MVARHDQYVSIANLRSQLLNGREVMILGEICNFAGAWCLTTSLNLFVIFAPAYAFVEAIVVVRLLVPRTHIFTEASPLLDTPWRTFGCHLCHIVFIVS